MPGAENTSPLLRRNRQFFTLFSSQAFGYFGRSIFFVVLPLFVLERTGSSLSMAISFLLTFIPFTIAGPPAGLLVDHFSRRNLLVTTSFLHALTLVLLPFLHATYLIFTIVFISSVYGVLISNSVASLLPGLVEKDLLARANSFYIGLRSATFLLGASAAYFLINTLGMEKVFFVCSSLMLLSGLSVLALKKDLPMRSLAREEGRRVPSSLGVKRAMGIISSNRSLRGLTIMHFLFLPIFGAFEVFLPAYSEKSLLQASYYTLLSAALGSGMLLGSLLTHRALRRTEPLRLVFLSFIGYSTGIFLLTRSNLLAVSMLICFGSGFTDGFGFTTYEYLRQRIVPEDFRGRVFTIMDALILLPLPLGYLFVGYLADRMSMVSLGIWISVGGIVLSLLCFPLTRSKTAV